MILKEAKSVYYCTNAVKKIYLGDTLVYTYVASAPPVVSEETMTGSSTAESYEEGSTSWGTLTLSAGCNVSQDGIEIQDEETYVSASISGMSYPMTFEFKGRTDSSCYKAQANNPGMLFGLGPTQDNWGDGITCYSTTEYGIIIDTTGAMSIVTGETPTHVHIVLVLNRSGALTMYMNGIGNSWTCGANRATRSTKTYIFNGQGAGRFVGAINTMRWWSTALSADEITQLFSKDSADYII